MWLLGYEISMADLLTVFSGIIVLCIFYLAFEIYKLKRVERRLERVEQMFEREEQVLEKEVDKLEHRKKR